MCSAWFLVGKTESNSKRKALDLICTVWAISIIYLIVFFAFFRDGISTINIIKSILPTCFGNYWYMTCYIIFLFIYPLLNRLIAAVSQKEHLRIVIFSTLIWVVADYVISDWFFPSMIILWCTIYFLIAYLKIYGSAIMNSQKIGISLLIIGILGVIAQVVVTNYVGMYFIKALSNKILRWNSNCCPFYLMIAIGGLIISLQSRIRSRFINYISGLSLFIYLIHENILVSTYLRPAIWQYIYLNFGYSKVLLWDLFFSLLLFVASIIVSSIYKATIQNIVIIVSKKVYGIVSDSYTKIEKVLLGTKAAPRKSFLKDRHSR